MKYPELTPNEIKGVDLCVRGLKRKYTFITGWEPMDDYRKYDNTLFITLSIDYNKLSDFFGLNIRPNMKRYINDYNDSDDWWGRYLYSLFAYMDIPDGSDMSYQTKKQMTDRLNLLYESLPPELQRTWISDFAQKEYPVNININSFLVH